jgi:hypothetical protein
MQSSRYSRYRSLISGRVELRGGATAGAWLAHVLLWKAAASKDDPGRRVGSVLTAGAGRGASTGAAEECSCTAGAANAGAAAAGAGLGMSSIPGNGAMWMCDFWATAGAAAVVSVAATMEEARSLRSSACRGYKPSAKRTTQQLLLHEH